MADIILGNSFKIYYNTDTGNTSLQGIGNVQIDNLAAFPTLTISSTSNSFETYDSDYLSKLLSEQTLDPLSISIYYVPDNAAAQYLDEVAESQQEFQIVLEYDYTDGKIAGAIVNGYINAYADSGDKDEVVTRTYTFVHSEVVMRSMSVTALNPVYQGDYGVGSNGADVGQYQPDVPTGNSFIKVPSSQTGNPTSTDLMGIGLVDGTSVAEFAMTKSGTLSLFAKNASTAWTRIYTVTQMDSTYVPLTRTINGKPLSSNVVLSASDLAGGTMTGALTVPALTVTGTTTLSGNTAAAAVTATSLTSSGSTATGSLTVSGTTTLTGVTTAGTVNASTVSVSGATKLTGTTTAGVVNAGATTATSLSVSGNTTHTGITTLTGLTTAGTVNASTVNVSGNTVLTGTTKLTGITTAGTINASDLTLTNALPITQGGTGNVNGTVGQLTTARTFVTNLASTTAVSFNGTANNSHGVTGILPTANGGTGNATGLASSATVLANARSITTDLGSNTAASFNGSANITPGVSGTLSVANGGTGSTSAITAAVNIGAMPLRTTPTGAGITDLNQMGPTSDYVGVWNLTNAANYGLPNVPTAQPGTLEVTATGWFSGQQKYTDRYGNTFIRGLIASWNATTQPWDVWHYSGSTYANLSAQDLDTVLSATKFYGNSMVNAPPELGSAYMFVDVESYASATPVYQTVTGSTLNRTFTRTYASGTWSQWVENANTGDSTPDNYIRNARFLNGGYLPVFSSTATATVEYVLKTDSRVPAGSTGEKVAIITKNATGALHSLQFGVNNDSNNNYISVSPGDVINYAFNIAATGLTTNAQLRICISTYNGTTLVANNRVGSYDGTSTGWQLLSGQYTIPANVTQFQVGVWSETTAPVNSLVFVTEPRVSKQDPNTLGIGGGTVNGATTFNGLVTFGRHDQAVQFSSSDATQPIIGINYSGAGNFGFWDSTNSAWTLRKATGTNDWIFPGAITLGTALSTSSGGTGNTTGNAPTATLAASATALATARTITTNLASTTAASFNGTANVTVGVSGVLPIANGGTGNSTGLAATATALATARTITTNLASTTAGSFNGTANIAPGVSGILGLANGGTGASTAAAARTNLGLGSASLLEVGTAAGTVAAGNDSRIVNSVQPNTTPNLSSIELYAATPFVDFHYANSTADYTNRLICDVAGYITLMAAGDGSGARFRVAGGYICKTGVSGAFNNSNAWNFNWQNGVGSTMWVDNTNMGAITFQATSDIQLKKDVEYIDSSTALSEVLQWKPAKFKYKARGIIPESETQYGFIANDLVEVSPDTVKGKGLPDDYDIDEDPNNPDAYSLDQVAMLAKLTMALQQQQVMIQSLQQQINK